MKNYILAAAVAAVSSTAAQAIVVDGSYDAAYGAATAVVNYNPAAPIGNFGAPTNENHTIGYSIFTTGSDGFVYGFLQASGPGAPVLPTFANVYFDIDSSPGSDLGFELGAASQRAFIPGGAGPIAISGIGVAVSADNLGIEFAIPVSLFTAPIAGLSDPGQLYPSVGGSVIFRLSQSFGYSVAGGPSYGPNRLGVAALTAVPEPATWALMIGGFGMVGVAARRRKAVVAA